MAMAKLKNSGDIEHLVLDHFGQENYQTNVLSIQILLYVSFTHILINLNSFMDTPISENIVQNIPPH
jgi:hypothetical protein